MAYFHGFVIPVPAANRAAFIEHSTKTTALMREFGASRVVDAWGDDVPDGKINDFKMAVQATAEETVCFGWMEYSDRAACDAAVQKIMTDPRMQAIGDMPFDGKRMIFGSFEPLLDESTAGTSTYVDGFIIPVPNDKREAYREMAIKSWPIFRDHGAIRQVETWGADVPHGEVTDFWRAAHAKDDEGVVFAFLEWPDRASRDRGMKAFMDDDRVKAMPQEMPFDGKRMIFGGFAILPTAPGV